jgi:hypothetical protein
MYDIFFISFDEPNADENWYRLVSRMPRAKRVHGIVGINNAHIECANQSMTKMFWTVDADTVVDDTFKFDYPVMPWDEKYLHVWHSRNPVNGLEYGYSAVKLWPCAIAKKKTMSWLDFSTTVGKIKMVETTISTTVFNTDSFNAWKSGFRESVKLSLAAYRFNDTESINRLIGWTRLDNTALYSTDTVNGVLYGIDYFLKNNQDIEKLQLINNFEWLKTEYNNTTANFDYNSLSTTILKDLGIHNV